MNPPDFFTVIFVPNARAKFRKYQIPLNVAKIAGRAAAVFGVVLAGALIHYSALLFEVSRLRKVEEESRNLLTKTHQIEQDAAALRAQMGQLSGIVTKLGVMAGVDAPPPDPSVGGTGGGTTADRSAPNVASFAEMSSRLNELTEKSRELTGVFEKQRSLLATTPSVWPVRGYLSAGFGNRDDPFTGLRDFHPGLDIAAPLGTKILAPADGTVIFVGVKGGYGNAVTIDHGRGIATHYGHLDAFNVRVGQQVRRGSVLGFVGSTGRSTAPHLHYEVWLNGSNQNPLLYILDEYRSLG
ncbi:MAG: M23 family metallopeptidase [Vicinamibacteria bacterium]|nr:M23 family metallopeptidase [Vicinamibacteria bacterium]